MKRIVFSSSLQKKLIQLQKKDFVLFRKVGKKLTLFEVNQRHPSLRLHKLKGDLKNVWSLSITMDVRMLFIENTEYYFFDIGTHNQVYRK